MKIINTKLHGILDYLMGTLLVALPWLTGPGSSLAPVFIGACLIVYSLLTRYEGSFIKSISMRHHLLLDMATGFVLVLLPWLLDKSGLSLYMWMGILQLCIALLSEKRPYQRHPNNKYYRHITRYPPNMLNMKMKY